MLVDSPIEQSDFSLQLLKDYQRLLIADPFSTFRAKAWDRFLELGLPSRKTEVYQYLRLNDLYAKSYALNDGMQVEAKEIAAQVYPECRNSLLVFVNGCYRPDLSNVASMKTKSGSRVVAMPMSEAMTTYGAFLSNRWTKLCKEETDAFALLNLALHPQGAFLYIPPKAIVSDPIQVLNIVSTDDPTALIVPRLQIFVGAQAEVTFAIDHRLLNGSGYVINQNIDFHLEEAAQVKLIELQLDADPSSWHLETIRATLKRDSVFKTSLVTEGAATIRNDYRVILTGENGKVSLSGAALLSGKKESHTNVWIEHQAPHCESMQLFKNVLNDFSRSGFEGKIVVRQAAQKTAAFQRNNNLLLSDRAHADSKPNLEIFADDVKASHGATVGQLNQDELFYLNTRGFSDLHAKSLLVYGYCQDVYDTISLPSARTRVDGFAKSYLLTQG